jgi:hypothetical protein
MQSFTFGEPRAQADAGGFSRRDGAAKTGVALFWILPYCEGKARFACNHRAVCFQVNLQ